MNKAVRLLKLLGLVVVGGGYAIGKIAKTVRGTKQETVVKNASNESAESFDEQFEALKKLKRLLDTGILSQSEFDAKKKKILNESKFREFFMLYGFLFGILGLMGLVGWMGERMIFEWMAENPIVVIGLIVLIILCGTTVMVLRHRRLMRQHDIDILNANVRKIGDDEADRIAGKYRDNRVPGDCDGYSNYHNEKRRKR
jgi:hypothetical protein